MADSPGWASYFSPDAKGKMESCLQQLLAGAGTHPEARLRYLLGQVVALKWVLGWPIEELRHFQLAVEEEIALAREEADQAAHAESVLEHGRYGPLGDDPEPEG